MNFPIVCSKPSLILWVLIPIWGDFPAGFFLGPFCCLAHPYWWLKPMFAPSSDHWRLGQPEPGSSLVAFYGEPPIYGDPNSLLVVIGSSRSPLFLVNLVFFNFLLVPHQSHLAPVVSSPTTVARMARVSQRRSPLGAPLGYSKDEVVARPARRCSPGLAYRCLGYHTRWQDNHRAGISTYTIICIYICVYIYIIIYIYTYYKCAKLYVSFG